MNTRARGLIVILLCVMGGAVLGAAADRAYMSGLPAHNLKEGRRHETRSGIPEQFVNLGLTEAQVRRMESIIQANKPQSDSLLKDILPRVKRIELNMKQELVCVLTPKQQQQWLAGRRRQHLNMKEAEVWLERVRSGKCKE